MLASAPELQTLLGGIAIDAQISRQPSAAPELLERLAQAGQLRSTVVLGLGTNGYWGTGTLERVLDVIGPSRKLVLVTAYAPRPWVQSVNTYDAQIAAAHPDQVALADWATAIDAQTSLLGPDRIHPDPAGGTLYAKTVADALTKLNH
jgi:lysophospholipase L1-like esterase